MVAVSQVLEPARGVCVGDLLGFRCNTCECIGEESRSALQNEGIKVIGIFGRDSLSEGSAKRMTYANYLRERAATNLAATEFLCK